MAARTNIAIARKGLKMNKENIHGFFSKEMSSCFIRYLGPHSPNQDALSGNKLLSLKMLSLNVCWRTKVYLAIILFKQFSVAVASNTAAVLATLGK